MLIEVLLYVLAIGAALVAAYITVWAVYALVGYVVARHEEKVALKRRIEYYKSLSRNLRR